MDLGLERRNFTFDFIAVPSPESTKTRTENVFVFISLVVEDSRTVREAHLVPIVMLCTIWLLTLPVQINNSDLIGATLCG